MLCQVSSTSGQRDFLIFGAFLHPSGQSAIILYYSISSYIIDDIYGTIINRIHGTYNYCTNYVQCICRATFVQTWQNYWVEMIGDSIIEVRTINSDYDG